MPFLEALRAAWADWPPLRKIVAAWMGHKPPERGNLADLVAMFPSGKIGG